MICHIRIREIVARTRLFPSKPQIGDCHLRYLCYYSRVLQENRKIMSQHSSLKSVSKIATKRNVLKRFERIELLKQRGQWKDGDRGTGLRKTKPII